MIRGRHLVIDDEDLLLNGLAAAIDFAPLDHAGLEHVKETLLVEVVGLAIEQRPA